MSPIFNGKGSTIGWLERDVVYDMGGTCVAFISDGAVYSYGGRYLGRLDGGFFRDKSGYAVAFIEGATGGPMTPLPIASPQCCKSWRVAPAVSMPSYAVSATFF